MEQSTARIYFPKNGFTFEPKVAREESLRLRILEQPLWPEALTIFDLIEVKQFDSETYEFVRVVEKSNWRTWFFLLTEEQAHSNALDHVRKKVEELSGVWALELGGCLSIALPPGTTYDPTSDVDGIQ